jgi:hypothetical protein
MVFGMSDSSSSRFRQFFILNFSFLIILSGCSPSYKTDVDAMVLQPAVEFNADSAYSQIANQVNFGPRIPGTDTHTLCGNYLVETLNRYGAQVMEQRDSVTVAAGRRIPMRNIIGSFSPEKKKRILLVAHWDSRPTSDQDPEHFNEPIDGAHDGASGVGVLLEVARLLAKTSPEIGVDILLFDTEDQGRGWEEGDTPDSEFFYCMGARYWAKQPHVAGYKADYAIMVDMVAAKDAAFTLEGESMKYAEKQTRHVWTIAHKLGYENNFRFNLTRNVLHDHFYIGSQAGIPCVAIMQHDNTTHTGYGAYWHTQADNLSSIDRNTLKAVGQTIVQVIFNDRAN